MQTHFTLKQLANPKIAEADSIIKSCQHFGFCTATCPTYVLLGDENDAPRGRIDLMRIMLENGGAPDRKTVGHIDRCLSCLACMTTCAVRVDFMHLVDRARIHIEEHHSRPLLERLLRSMVAHLLPRPALFRTALWGAKLARVFVEIPGNGSPVGASMHKLGAKRLRNLMPRRLGNLLSMVPPHLPPKNADIRPGVHAAAGPRRYRVALLAGCAQRVLAPSINAATVRLLTRHGCEVVIAPQGGCCGALTLHMGREEDAIEAARRNVEAWIPEVEAGRLDAILVNASGCGTMVKDYGHLLQHDPRYATQAALIAELALDVSEWMERIGLFKPQQPCRYAVAYHDACSLRNAQRVTEPPRRLLAAAGYVVRDVPEAQMCCGSAGTYNLLQPDIAEQLGQRKGERVRSTGAAFMAAGNLGCLVQIGRYVSLPVVHTVELLDWATGGPKPAALDDVQLQEVPDSVQEVGAGAAIW